MSSESLKCVVVGDGGVGKTCLLIRYAKDDFPQDYVPTVFDSYAVSLPIGGDTYEVHLFDTAGQEDYDQLRRLAFSNTDVLLICFAVNFWPSYENVREMWVPEIRKYCPGVPYLIVGTRIDLRNDQQTIDKLAAEGKSPISKAHGERLAREVQALKYVECSALTKENVGDVFKEAILAALFSEKPSSTPVASPIVKENYTSNTTTNNNTRNQSDDDCCSCCTSENCTIL